MVTNDDDGGDDGVGDDDGGKFRIFNGNDGEWLARVRLVSSTGGDGGAGTSSTRKNDNGHCTIAECVVRLKEQDCLFDDARPWVIFAPQTKAMIEKCTEIGAGRMNKSPAISGAFICYAALNLRLVRATATNPSRLNQPTLPLSSSTIMTCGSS